MSAQKQYTPKRNSTQIRHQRVRERFNELYNNQRIRIDDVIKTISSEMGYSPSTIEKRILKQAG